MDVEWVQRRPELSWHAVRDWTRVPGRARTVCGRTVSGETSDALPAEKSCETCLRIVARRSTT